jgi:hypothetical protein
MLSGAGIGKNALSKVVWMRFTERAAAAVRAGNSAIFRDSQLVKESKMEMGARRSDPGEVVESQADLERFSPLPQGLISFSFGLNLLLLEYIVLAKVTSLDALLAMTTPFYALASLTFMVGLPFLFGAAVIQAVTSENTPDRWRRVGISLLGGLFGLLSIGCPTCGAPLLTGLGFEGGLAAFPLQGLAIKFIALLLLAISLWPKADRIAGHAGETPVGEGSLISESPASIDVWKMNWRTSLVMVAAITALFVLPLLPERAKMNFATEEAVRPEVSEQAPDVDVPDLAEQVNPAEGFTFQVSYGDLGPQLLASGAIDEEKFASVYARGGNPLTSEQRGILTAGSDEEIVITRQNAHFLLNFFWALGLVNENPILDEGPMMTYSDGEIGRFASTGGWSLGAEAPKELYSSAQILPLSQEQQELVETVAAGVFRPCCNNPTIFPDCNHGMAMFGLLELLAANGADEGELFEAAKSANAFWFPQQMLEVATYFQAVKDVDFADLDPRTAVGSTYFSGSGFQSVNAWLADNGLIRQAPSQGGSCGV